MNAHSVTLLNEDMNEDMEDVEDMEDMEDMIDSET